MGTTIMEMRKFLSGSIIEFVGDIPIQSDGIPLGLELDGSIVSIPVYHNLLKRLVRPENNETAEDWYRCDQSGVRSLEGNYVKLPDYSERSLHNTTYIVIV